MMRARARLRWAGAVLLGIGLAVTSGQRGGADDEHAPPAAAPEAAHAAADADVATLRRFGVTLATAGPDVIDPGLELPGEIRPDATRTAHVAAPFAGTVRSVRVRAGDRVGSGDVLAVIESRSLAAYELRAPFAGIVVSQLVTAGETADSASPAFLVADLRTVWAEISVYQKHLAQVRPGQRVRITAGYDVAATEATISYVTPVLDETTRTATARAVLANDDGRWRPGMFVSASVLDPVQVAVAVPASALQRIAGETVVFVAADGRFRTRAVQVGRTSPTTAEITAGLAAGERCAAANSYLVKAELEKSAAGEDGH
jgi:cobalt-zinc-cadmium efflux system membrane fusion protein